MTWRTQVKKRVKSVRLQAGDSLVTLVGGVTCPVCGTAHRQFETHYGRKRAICPSCGALERHRQFWVWAAHTGLLARMKDKRVLHFAPEPGMARGLAAAVGPGYLSGDLAPGAAMRVVDVCAIDFPDETFDFVLCSHVLEHVPDDRAAMSELLRVLKPGGFAVVEVPIGRLVTEEDPDCTDPQERLRRFGQVDHVRTYGWDVFDRLTSVGFEVEVEDVRDYILADERRRYGLTTALPWSPEDARELWIIPVAHRRPPASPPVSV